MCPRGVDPQGLVQDGLEVGELEDRGGVDLAVGAVAGAYLGRQPGEHVGGLEYVIECCGQACRRGFTAGDAVPRLCFR